MSDSLYQKLLKEPFFIAGPCVIESEDLLQEVAEKLVSIKANLGVEIIFKASFDKANRTSISSFRGPGLEKGLAMLQTIKDRYGLAITTDIHESHQAEAAGEVLDIIQIPAFLCRQTDLLVASAKTGKIVNIKKGQFLSGADMRYPVEKVKASGNDKVFLTERGNIFGYNNLIVDFRNIADMRQWAPVIMDCTHAVQRPGGSGGTSGGDRKFAPKMALAAKVFGAGGFFIETHPNPDKALSDGPNMIPLDQLEKAIADVINLPV
ncbi:MAG: 3-deoxy-8-phosphooctulonate synthase [Bacteroidia bacterium]